MGRDVNNFRGVHNRTYFLGSTCNHLTVIGRVPITLTTCSQERICSQGQGFSERYTFPQSWLVSRLVKNKATAINVPVRVSAVGHERVGL